ncbi:phosphoglycerate kinase [Hellea sp.]|nr:phosphoglycerate kinase [Hellea sp.]
MDFNRLKGTRLKGKTAIVRVDFNVPRNKDGSISDDTRLQSALPTIKHLQKAGAKTILLSHYGRPNGKPNKKDSLRFIVPALVEALDSEVLFSPTLNPNAVDLLEPGGVMLMENTRFHKGETEGDKALAQEFADLGDIYIQDAFSAAHRNHASSAVIGELMPSYAGLAMERELDHISQALIKPKSPVMGVVGGAKVSTKIDLLKNLVSKLDILVIGGGMANTFLFAQGHKVGSSLCEKDLKDTALEILKTAKKEKCQIILPTDVVVAKEFKANAKHRQCDLASVKSTEMILDCGTASVEQLMDAMDSAKTLIWNGPLGAFELSPFDTSTVEAAKYAAKLTKKGKLVSVAGGGDTVAALKHAGAADDFTFISTAGGAFLEWMEGKPLPGVEILKK